MPSGPVSESTALLHDDTVSGEERAFAQSESAAYGTNGEEEAAHLKIPDLQTTWKEELRTLAKYSPPLILTYVLQYSFSLVTVYVAGRLGTNELGAASLASMTANITGLCVYEGLATSLDTLASQAFGSGKKLLVGLHVQRMAALVLLVTVPIGLVWGFSPYYLGHLIPSAEKDIAKLAGRFMQIYLIGAPGWGIFESGKRFTQAQGNFNASLWVLLVCAPVNIFLNWLLVFYFDLRFEGAALAVAISNNLQPIVLVIYIYYFAPSTLQCWPGLQPRQACQKWGPMIKLAIPGVLMTLSEWLAFDILTFASSYLSAEHLAAQSVVMTCCVMMYHIPFPISIAASTRFGNLIGYGALEAARTTWRTAYMVFLVIGIFDLILLTTLRYEIAWQFSSDEIVRYIITGVLPLVAAAQMFDALLACSNGLMRGLGRQKIGGWINLGVYYLFALPLSFFLTFGPLHMDKGLSGLWIGPLCGLGAGGFIMFLYMKYADWTKAVEDARAREE